VTLSYRIPIFQDNSQCILKDSEGARPFALFRYSQKQDSTDRTSTKRNRPWSRASPAGSGGSFSLSAHRLSGEAAWVPGCLAGRPRDGVRKEGLEPSPPEVREGSRMPDPSGNCRKSLLLSGRILQPPAPIGGTILSRRGLPRGLTDRGGAGPRTFRPDSNLRASG
jgi:hypothetical protein